MNIGSKIGVKQDGQDFGCMRNNGDSSRLKTTTTATTSTSSGFTNSSKNSNNYNGFFSPSSPATRNAAALDGSHHLTSEPWIESCVQPSFLSSPHPLPSNNSGNSKFSVFGDPVTSSFSNYSNSHHSNNHTESFCNSSNRQSEGNNSFNNVNCHTTNNARQDGGQLESSLASLSLSSSKTASNDRKAPLTIETKASTAPKSWASIASQPAKTGKTASLLKVKMAAASALTASTRPAPIVATLEAIGSWEAKNGSCKSQIASPPFQSNNNMKHSPWSSSFSASSSTSSDPTPDQSCSSTSSGRDLPSLNSQSVTSGNTVTCNVSPSNNNNSSNTATSNSNSYSNNHNHNINNTNHNHNNNSYSTSNSTTSLNGNNSSSVVAQRRPGPLTSSSSIESSVSSSARASVNHHSFATTTTTTTNATTTATTTAATISSHTSSSLVTSTAGATTGRQVHNISIGGLRDARYEKENGYRESNNHYVNIHKRNWRESNVDPATVTDDTFGKSCSNNGPNNNCHNRVQKRIERTVCNSNSEHVAHLEAVVDPSAIMDKQKLDNLFNPKEFDLNPTDARFFVIKSYSEDDIHRSIKYSIWCSTEHGNKRLDNAFKSQEAKGPVYLFYSVNGSGHFCGMAQMMSGVDYDSSVNVWAQDKWKGQFKVKWIYVKDVPNSALRHIRLENNENKQVTNSRDTQEVPLEKGKQVLKIIHSYVHSTSIFDDFLHYEKRQEEETTRKIDGPGQNNRGAGDFSPSSSSSSSPLAHSRKEPSTLTSNRHNQPDSDGYPRQHQQQQHRDIHRNYRDHRDHPPPPPLSLSSSTTHRGDYHRDYRNSHKAPLEPSEREEYEERRYDTTTGDNSAHRDHRYSNHTSVRNYDQGARDYHYQPRRPVHHHHRLQQQGHAPHYHSNSSSHHNQRTSWRE